MTNEPHSSAEASPAAGDDRCPHPPRDGRFSPFVHLSGDKAGRYRRLLRVFADAKEGFVVHLRPEDVAAALGETITDDGLTDELDALERWGNLRTTPDTSRVTTVEEFRRRRKLYALTPAGEAAEAALETYAATLSRRAELQGVALADIRDRLRALLRLAEADEPDAGQAAATLRDLEVVFRGLADNASAFMASLTRSIDTAAEGVAGFLAYKDRLIGYLQRFVGDLVVASAEIASLLATLDELGVDRLFAAAARRQAADAAPGAAEDDENDPVAAAEASHHAAWRARWDGLHRWFVGGGRPSQAELLRARARSAIPDLLEAVAELHDRRSGRSDRTADFRTLAYWFAEAPSDDDAHRLWRVAFGLAPARHLTVEPDVLDARRDDPVAPSTPWALGPTVEVSARLRRTGRYQRRGRVVVEDRTAARAALADLLHAERAELAEARRRLATGRSVRLSQLRLDPVTFPLFLRLLGDALAADDGNGRIATLSTDGTMRIELDATADGAVAEVVTPDGVLRGRDHVLRITDLLATPT